MRIRPQAIEVARLIDVIPFPYLGNAEGGGMQRLNRLRARLCGRPCNSFEHPRVRFTRADQIETAVFARTQDDIGTLKLLDRGFDVRGRDRRTVAADDQDLVISLRKQLVEAPLDFLAKVRTALKSKTLDHCR